MTFEDFWRVACAHDKVVSTDYHAMQMAWNAARIAERERCALICEKEVEGLHHSDPILVTAFDIAVAIRGEK